MIVRFTDKWGGTGSTTGLTMLFCRLHHEIAMQLPYATASHCQDRAGRVLANHLSQAGLSLLVYIHYCLIAAAVACIAASLANNPFQGEPLERPAEFLL